MARIFKFAILVYQVCISPLFPAPCRYWPTCSVYATQAIRDHGALSGVLLALRRIGRCNPWGGWGYDPVPAPCGVDAHSSGHAHGHTQGRRDACPDHADPRRPDPRHFEHGHTASMEPKL